MRPNVKDRLNKKLVDNNMTQLGVTVPLQEQQLPKRLYKNRTNEPSECENRLNNTMDDGTPYGNGAYDDRIYEDYISLQDPVDEPYPGIVQSLVPGNEQLLIIFIFGLAAYAMYLHSKSKDSS